MNAAAIEKQFTRMGARAKIGPINPRSRTRGSVSLDIRRDEDGPYFDIGIKRDEINNMVVSDVRPNLRHLVLMCESESDRGGIAGDKQHFLCGHDERDWFVAAVPKPVTNVPAAMEALKPKEVVERQNKAKVKHGRRNRRRNEAFIRQGEWFFMPEPALKVDSKMIHKNEPIRRGGGKPHMVEELYRTGGTNVHVSGRHPNGLAESEYKKLLKDNPDASKWNWQVMRRDPVAYARGKVRHSDHKTITLCGWHRICMNTESKAQGFANVAFLD